MKDYYRTRIDYKYQLEAALKDLQEYRKNSETPAIMLKHLDLAEISLKAELYNYLVE